MALNQKGKWQVPAEKVILNYLKNQKEFIAEPQIRLKCFLGQKTCNSNLHRLFESNILKRKQCPCGRGWLYKLS